MTPITLDDLRRYSELFQLVSGIPVVIAGGAPRDIYLGLEPKDIDIFFPYNEYHNHWKKTQYLAKNIFGSTFEPAKRLRKETVYDPKFDSVPLTESVRDVYNLTTKQGHKLQVVLFKHGQAPAGMLWNTVSSNLTQEINVDIFAKKILKTFDYDICKIAYYQGDLHFGKAFKREIKNKTFTLTTKNKELTEREKERRDRLQGKLQGFTFVHEVEKEPEVTIKSSKFSGLNTGTSAANYYTWTLHDELVQNIIHQAANPPVGRDDVLPDPQVNPAPRPQPQYRRIEQIGPITRLRRG